MGTKYTNYLASIIKAKLLTHLELMKRKILKMCQLNLFLQIFACLKFDSHLNSKWLTRTSKLQRWSPIPTNCEESSESIVRDEFTLTKASTTTTSRFLGWVVVAAATEATSHLLLLEFSSPWLCSICQLHRSLSGMASQVISSKMWRKNFPIKQGSFFLFFRSQLLSLAFFSFRTRSMYYVSRVHLVRPESVFVMPQTVFFLTIVLPRLRFDKVCSHLGKKTFAAWKFDEDTVIKIGEVKMHLKSCIFFEKLQTNSWLKW